MTGEQWRARVRDQATATRAMYLSWEHAGTDIGQFNWRTGYAPLEAARYQAIIDWVESLSPEQAEAEAALAGTYDNGPYALYVCGKTLWTENLMAAYGRATARGA